MKTLAKILLYPLCALMFLGSVLYATPKVTEVYAETAGALQAELEDILAKVALVRARFNLSPSQPTSIEIPLNFRFSRTLVPGAHGADVRYLQILLNRDPDTRVNAQGLIGGAGFETDYFGRATRIAIGKFQNKYAADVLRPARLLKDTGTVGPLTRNKLNALLTLSFQTNAVSSPPTTTPVAPRAAAPTFSFDEINQKTRLALVNILCTSNRSGSFNLVSGSGVIIDPRGVILTNAHLGQYFLLQDFPTPGSLHCVVRTGEPAHNSYKATLLFIPSAWVHDNASKVAVAEPTGTGENDFALLLIQGTTSDAMPLPDVFPYVPMEISASFLREPTEVLIAAYPAGFLSSIAIQKDLYPSSSIVMTGIIYSFGESTADIFSVGGSVVAQQGSSGGPVVNREGNLIGLIVTSSTGKTTGERDLDALTMTHIDSSFRKQTGESIRSLLSGDIKLSAQSFAENVAPELKKIFQDEMTKR